MKEIKSYKMGDHIPSNAKFLVASNERKMIKGDPVPGTTKHRLKEINYAVFLYEVPIMTERKNNTDDDVIQMTRDVIEYLNSKTGKSFSAVSKGNRDLIRARINTDAATLEMFTAAIDNMVAQWGEDPKWSQYLRPSTLFGAKKFDGYVNMKSGTQQAADAFAELESFMS
jgi:uncharacterized phage protein (TIGR02220 family)